MATNRGEQVANSSSSSPSSAASSSSSSSDALGTSYVQKYLTNCKSFYSCIYCRTHLANHDELVSRSFQGNRSRAYLFNSVINISCGPAVQRELNTGAHAVADICCSNCGTTMGWKYERAYVDSQKYKEGKFIIELAHVVRENRHLEMDKRDLIINMSQQLCGGGGGPEAPSDFCGRHACGSSLSPDSASRWPSPTSSTNSPELDDDDLDEDEVELIFPFYDDLYSLDRSSYRPSLSDWRRFRLAANRRSLNSAGGESASQPPTVSCWKYSSASAALLTGAACDSPPEGQAAASAATSSGDLECASLGRAASCVSPATSCDNSDADGRRQPKRVCSEQNQRYANCCDKKHYNRLPEDADETTQFVFEADSSASTSSPSSSSSSGIGDSRTTATPPGDVGGGETGARPLAGPSNSAAAPRDNSQEQTTAAAANVNAGRGQTVKLDLSAAIDRPAESVAAAAAAEQQRYSERAERLSARQFAAAAPTSARPANSASLDDEEFYDCCTSHDV